MIGDWNFDEIKAIYKAARDIQIYTDTVTGGNGLEWMNHNLGGVNITQVNNNSRSFIPRNRDSAFPALLSGTGKQTVFLVDNWLWANGKGEGPRWLVHEMGHVWDMHTGVLFFGGIYGGVADHMNKAMGGTIMLNPFVCRYCDNSGAGNNNPFVSKISYGNNSSADYQAEVFALSIYPNEGAVPMGAQNWMEKEIRYGY